MFKKNNSTKAFTLLEILLVVGIIALLAGIVIVAINPGRQLAQTRNAERKSDLKQLHSAMTQYYIDHGFYPASTTLSTTLKEICDTGSTSSPSGLLCTGLIDLSELVPTYITAIPKDPQGPLAQRRHARRVRRFRPQPDDGHADEAHAPRPPDPGDRGG